MDAETKDLLLDLQLAIDDREDLVKRRTELDAAMLRNTVRLDELKRRIGKMRPPTPAASNGGERDNG